MALKRNVRFPGWSRELLHEAAVLQALAGVAGVPRLHGVTHTAPHVLVMSRCPGVSLAELRRRGKVRLCLTALLRLCDIVSAVHGRRVTHRDLHAGNVLVSVKDMEAGVEVWLVDFGAAVMCAGRKAVQADEAQLTTLVRDTLRDARQHSDQDTLRRRSSALTTLTATTTSFALHHISAMIRTVLRDAHSRSGAKQSTIL